MFVDKLHTNLPCTPFFPIHTYYGNWVLVLFLELNVYQHQVWDHLVNVFVINLRPMLMPATKLYKNLRYKDLYFTPMVMLMWGSASGIWSLLCMNILCSDYAITQSTKFYILRFQGPPHSFSPLWGILNPWCGSTDPGTYTVAIGYWVWGGACYLGKGYQPVSHPLPDSYCIILVFWNHHQCQFCWCCACTIPEFDKYTGDRDPVGSFAADTDAD